MRLAASDEDEIALIHADLLPALESERGRPPAQVVERRVRQRGQSQTPGQAQLVVKEKSPAQADARQYVRENVQTQGTFSSVDDRTQYSDSSILSSGLRSRYDTSHGKPDQQDSARH